MIRFCDREICCVIEGEWNRTEFLNYFLNGHRNEMICILAREGEFIGSITYNSLLGKEIEESIQKDYVIFDQNIWKNARDFFCRSKRDIGIVTLLPVLNTKKQLICFAWQDDEANRELRMLDELQECRNAFTFKDVFPEFDRVVVNGFNELAYYFVKYLDGIGMPVHAIGELWNEYGFHRAYSVLDYRDYHVYAEGTGNLKKEVELRYSVSAEFECVDQIYEENICKGIIKNTDGKFSDLLAILKDGKKQIGIIGTGEDSLNAYDLFLRYGIDISFFISDEKKKELFGKKIICSIEEIKRLKNVVFIEACAKHSVWGFGNLDFYHYLGYRRNKEIFLLRDYVEIPNSGMLNILKYIIGQCKRRIILIGDYWLCLKLKQILEEQKDENYSDSLFYLDVFNENGNKSDLHKIYKKETENSDIYLLLLCRYYSCYTDESGKESYHKWVFGKYVKSLDGAKIIDYQIENTAFINHTVTSQNYKNPSLKVKKIIIGSINGYSGHTLFRGILDNHPEIVLLDYGYLNDNLYSVCIRLAMETSGNIITMFWNIMKEISNDGRMYNLSEENWDEERILIFNQNMKSLLSVKKTFSSQELFVIIHIAYAKSLGKEIMNISDMVIYWEPHMDPGRRENFSSWLSEAAFTGEIVNVVRNAYMRAGSYFRACEDRFSISGMELFEVVLQYPNREKKEYEGWRRTTIRFEDLKCKPEKELRKLCSLWQIAWKDTLLETTVHGKKDYYTNVTGFDLKPVYRTYEEYFSLFDRFRISLILGPWQKQYGYPYERSIDYSRRELQKMFLYDFRFEEKFVFHSMEEKIKFKRWVQRLIGINMWITRSQEIVSRMK